MAKWEQLIAARVRMHLSQLEAAERVNVGLVTYQRWERGKRRPQPHHMRSLCGIFGPQLVYGEQTAYLEDMPSHEEETSSFLTPSVSNPPDLIAQATTSILLTEEDQELRSLLTTHMTAHLWSLVLRDHATSHEKRCSIRQAIEEFDSMNAENKNYQITRREAIGTLATLPLITFGLTLPGKEIASAQYGSVLAQCAASLEACWELYENGNKSEMLLGFQCASKYLTTLRNIGQASAQYQKETLHLATQYALLKTILGWHCAGPTATIQYAREAVALSREVGDISLQLSAYNKLAWAYSYEKKYIQALASAQEAEVILEHYEQQPNGEPVPSSIRGGIYSTLALMQVKNGQLSDRALGKATERDPGNDVYAYLDFTRSTMLLEAGWIYCYQDNHTKVMEVLEKRIDPETFSSRIQQTEIGRIETLNIMALSSLKAKDRDIERTIHFWKAAVEEAKTLRSDFFFDMAFTTYEHMAVVWPGERRIRELRGHLEHWEEE